MKNSQRVTELEAKTQKQRVVKLYYCSDGVYTTADDKRVLTDEEVEKLSDDDDVFNLIITFV